MIDKAQKVKMIQFQNFSTRSDHKIVNYKSLK